MTDPTPVVLESSQADATALVSPTPKPVRRSSWFGWPKKGSNGPQRPNSALSRVVEGEVAAPSGGWALPEPAPSNTTSTANSTTSSPSDERTSPFDSSPITPLSPGTVPPLLHRSSSHSAPKATSPSSSSSRPSSSSGLDLSMNRTHSLPAANNMSMLTPTSPPTRPVVYPSPLTRQLSLTELDKKVRFSLLRHQVPRSVIPQGRCCDPP